MKPCPYLMIPYSQRRGTVIPSWSYYLIETFNASFSSVAWWWPWLSIQSWCSPYPSSFRCTLSTSPPPPPFLLFNSSCECKWKLHLKPLPTSQPPDIYWNTLDVLLLSPMSIQKAGKYYLLCSFSIFEIVHLIAKEILKPFINNI